jgi:hypothetical protein
VHLLRLAPESGPCGGSGSSLARGGRDFGALDEEIREQACRLLVAAELERGARERGALFRLGLEAAVVQPLAETMFVLSERVELGDERCGAARLRTGRGELARTTSLLLRGLEVASRAW